MRACFHYNLGESTVKARHLNLLYDKLKKPWFFSMFFTGTVQFRLFLFSRQIMCPKSPLYPYNFNKLHHLFECFRKIPCDKKIKIRLSKNRVRKSRKMKQPKENRVSRLVCFVYEYSIWWLFCTNSLKKTHNKHICHISCRISV